MYIICGWNPQFLDHGRRTFWRGPRRYIHMRMILEGIDVGIRPGLIQRRLCVWLELFEHRQRDRDTGLACRGIQAIKLLREAYSSMYSSSTMCVCVCVCVYTICIAI
ncbi:hypothetical protein P167DRAFT_532724, partial [Morchella conica CCBAS932]